MKKFMLLFVSLFLFPLEYALSQSCTDGSFICDQILAPKQSEFTYPGDPAKLFSDGGQLQSTYNLDKIATAEKNFCITEASCGYSTTLSQDYTDFLFSFASVTKTNERNFESSCLCLRKTFTARYSPEELANEKAKARVDANKKIKEAFGKKFVNDFSSNLEDLSFFLTKNKDMFKDPDKAKFSQCLDPDGFNNEIESACRKSGISDPEIIRQRKDFFINSVDNGNMPFEKRLMKMSEDIVSLKYPDAPGIPKGTVYSRFEYDNARMGLAHSDSRGIILDELIKKFILSKKFLGNMDRALESMPPALAIESLLIETLEDPTSLKSLGLSPQALAVLNDGPKLKEHFHFLMNTHPGFMSLMETEGVLRNLLSELKKDPSKSILEHLENNPHVLEPVWKVKCIEMQEEFALAVCTPDENLISIMEPDDFSKLLKPVVDPNDVQSGSISDLLMCEERDKDSKKLKGLSRMNPDMPSHRSDYFERLTVPDVRQHKNMFSKSMLASMNKDFRDKMGEMAAKGVVLSKSVSLPGILSATVYAKAVSEDKAFSFGKQAMDKSEAKKLLKADKEYSDKINEVKLAKKEKDKAKQIESQKSSQNPNLANIQDPTVKNQSAVGNSARTLAPQVSLPRQQLQRKLAETYKPSQISQALDKLSSENAVELNALRSQNVDLLQKNYDLEKQRMETLQKRVEELQTKVDKASSPATAVVARNPMNTNTTSNPDTEDEAPRVVKTDTAIQPAVAPVIAGVAPADKIPDISQEEPSNGRSKPAVIKKESVASSMTVESPEDLISAELKKAVESTDPEKLSLEDIKKNGLKIIVDKKEIIVKYESLDQMTKDLLELKFAKKERDQQVSKLAVLKMLMSQQRR